MKKNKKKKKFNFYKFIGLLVTLLFLVCSGLLIYFQIVPTIYLIIGIVVGAIIIFLFDKVLFKKKIKKWLKNLVCFFSIILTIIFIVAIMYLYGTIDFFSDIFDSGLRTDTYSVYVLKDSGYEKIKDLNDKIIGVTDKKDTSMSKAIDKVSNKIEYNMAEFDTLEESINNLENSNIDGIIALSSNVDLLKEDNNQYSNLKSIYSFTVTTKVKTKTSKKNVTKENFVLYISGIDTNGKVDEKARSDVNIILAVNPTKHKILMVNTPRDYYVKLHTKNSYDKLTHAGVYGIEESIGTLEDLYDIDIDFYARVNFTSFVNIVDTLGGITVDVPVSFCEQTSSRTSSAQICLNTGTQTLTGEKALALAITRHTLSGGDRTRGSNQMLVLESIINKAMSPSILVKYNSLLKNLNGYVITNVESKTVTKLVKSQITSKDEWTFESYSVDGSDASSTTYSTGSQVVYVMKPDEKTVTEAKELLDEVLETKKYTSTTTTKNSSSNK